MKALMIALLVLVALCPLRPVLAQGYTQELMHTYVFGTEGTGADLICKRALVILYQDNLSSSGASIANVMMLMGLDRKGGNTRTLVTFRLNDEWGGTWKQVPVSKFFLFAGEAGAIAANEIVPPIISKPCTEQPQDICHMMRSADDVMLESYIGGESQLERSKDFVGLKKHFPYLQMATTGEWGIGFSRGNNLAGIRLRIVPFNFTDAVSQSAELRRYGECVKTLSSMAQSVLNGQVAK